MFEDYMDGTCNIYHLEDGAVNVGYGIKAGSVRVPQGKPSIEDVKCHFHVRNNALRIVQKEPYSSIDGDVKLSLSAGTDIKENDIVENCLDGLKYRAGIPKTIHGGHHIIVTLSRQKGPGEAI